MSDTFTTTSPPETAAVAMPTRPARFGPMLVGATVGVALLILGTAGLLVLRRTAPTGPTGSGPAAGSVEADRPPASRERQLATHRLADWKMDPYDRLTPAEGVTATFEPALRPAPPFDAIDATLLDAFDVRIRLAHARPVGREEACLDVQGNRFACGLRGRASLQNFLFGKKPSCIRLFLVASAAEGAVDARCSVDGEDLAERQIRAGWAFPSELADAGHRAALEAARREHLGVWAGPYELPRVDHSLVDAREVPFGSLRRQQ